MSGLLLVMDDYANPRVQAHAGAALVNFSEDCPKNILAPYLDLIISKLEQVLMAKVKEVWKNAFTLFYEILLLCHCSLSIFLVFLLLHILYINLQAQVLVYKFNILCDAVE